MPHFDPEDEFLSTNSHFLAPSAASTSRKSPSRQPLSSRRSAASLRGPSSLAHVIDDDSTNGRHHSLAHELAVALMPEPSAGSKLLAEEFGIEFDEGAEGIDEVTAHHDQLNGMAIEVTDVGIPTFASELASSAASDASLHDFPAEEDEPPNGHEIDPVFNSPPVSRKAPVNKKPEQDAMEVLAQDLDSTDKFLSHLRSIDVDPGTSASHPTLEKLASDVIRRINVSVRDREGHVRELLEYEREFKKIAGEVGGSDILGQLDELTHVEDLLESTFRPEPIRSDSRHLDTVEEEPRSPTTHHTIASDWELDPDVHHLGDEDGISEPATSPIKDSFHNAPSINGPPTPATTVAQLTHLRSFTTSLVSSLTTISEQAQVNGAATTEAGRKIRALKNKLGGWRTEWDSAERSRLKIERWEAGIIDGEGAEESVIPNSPSGLVTKRVDGRKIVEEHLRAFELALAEAALKTQAIMAR
ncbi:hypothetical protein JR316_0008130 [Psilocybe cubensis]|uniref:Uncharacterized protein n=2 Tax=Psilocybe cubensis TaxID=181762 RepID=A0ACB8GVC7_PSICU|nr:hypothetical protein JR316_0008130 [Psilocybe cubensis]KAH9479536.1 hypothetical protein JR316_0008130 [Psilocybe cubensis]